MTSCKRQENPLRFDFFDLVASQRPSEIPLLFREGFSVGPGKEPKKTFLGEKTIYCLGIFMGNELEWPDRIGPTIESLPGSPDQEMGD